MLKSLLSACFVLATTAVMPAAHADKQSTEPRSRVNIKDLAKPDTGWIELADPTPANHGREFITVDEDTRPVVRLRLAAHSGRPKIHSIQIDTDDGKQRVIRINKVLGKKPYDVTLRGARKLVRLMVVSEGNAKATYTLYGQVPEQLVRR